MSVHMDRMFAVSKRAIDKAAGSLWPRRSIISGKPAGGSAPLAPGDMSTLRFISGPVCVRCGSPHGFSYASDTPCAPCHAHAPRWRRARAALEYDDISARPILALKRAGRRDGLETMASWMHRASDDVLQEADVITAVPLHRARLAERGYNQSVWLGAALGRRTGLPLEPGLLTRKRNTPSQGGLSARARRRNMQGAFEVAPKHALAVAGLDIVLVDDVLTTGATVDACVLALKRAGASNVDVVTVARVVRERDVTI